MEEEDKKNPLRLVGLYNARGDFQGEMSYFTQKFLLGKSCALCDLTHRYFSQQKEWKDFEKTLLIPLVFFHKEDTPETLRVLGAKEKSCFLLQTDRGYHLLFREEELRAFKDNLPGFTENLREKIKDLRVPLTAIFIS